MTPSAATPNNSAVPNPTFVQGLAVGIARFTEINKRPPTDAEIIGIENSLGLARTTTADMRNNATPAMMEQSNAAAQARGSAAPPRLGKNGKPKNYTGPGGKSLLWPNAGSPPAPVPVAVASQPTPTAAPPVPAANPATIKAAAAATTATAVQAAGATAGGPAAPVVPQSVGPDLASAMPPPPRAKNPDGTPASIRIDPSLWTPEAIARANPAAGPPLPTHPNDMRGQPRGYGLVSSTGGSSNIAPAGGKVAGWSPTYSGDRTAAPPPPLAPPLAPAQSAPPTTASRIAALDQKYPAIAAITGNNSVPSAAPAFGPQGPTVAQTRATFAALDQKYHPERFQTPQEKAVAVLGGVERNDLNGPSNAIPGSTLPQPSPTPAPPSSPAPAPALSPTPSAAPPGVFGTISKNVRAIPGNVASSFGGSPLGRELVGMGKTAAVNIPKAARAATTGSWEVIGSAVKGAAKDAATMALKNPNFRGSQFANYLERKIPSAAPSPTAAPPPPPRSLVLR